MPQAASLGAAVGSEGPPRLALLLREHPLADHSCTRYTPSRSHSVP